MKKMLVKILKIVVSVLFVAGLVIPFAKLIHEKISPVVVVESSDKIGENNGGLSDEMNVSGEKVVLFPNFEWSFEYLARVGEYFDNNFGYRKDFIYWNAKRDMKALKSSPNKTVIVGNNNWLFASDFVLEEIFTDKELDVLAKKTYKLQKYIERNGQQFLFVLVPDKENVYPENMLWNLRILIDKNYSRFSKALVKNSVNFVDLKETLVSHKKDTIIYSLLDTHWNRYGSYLGFEAVMKSLGMNYPKFESFDEYERYGDLSRTIGLGEAEMTKAVNLSSFKKTNESIFVFCDSFGQGFFRYFEKVYKRVGDLYLKENPYKLYSMNLDSYDTVILQAVERHISYLNEVL